MKLLILLTDAFGGRGGIAKFNRDLLRTLAELPGCDEIVALPRCIRDHDAASPHLERLDFRIMAAGSKRRYAWHTLRAAVSESFDGVVCGHLNLAPLAALTARVKGVPFLQVIHGIEAWSAHSSGLVRRALGAATAVVAVSHYTRERFLAWSGIPAERVHVIPNSIDISSFPPGPKPTEILRRYGLQDRSVILTVGRLDPNERYKGIDEVIELLPEIAGEMPNVSYMVAGEGADRSRLEQKAIGLGVGERVVFTGYVPESEKADHFRAADAYVMPGSGEGFGIVYLEALACGLPVVASTRDASREAVRDGLLGRVVDPTDGSALKAAIVESLREPRRDSSRDLEYFSFERFKQRWADVINKIFVRNSRNARRLPESQSQQNMCSSLRTTEQL